MLETTPLSGVIAMVGDVAVAVVIVACCGFLIGCFFGGIVLGYTLIAGIAG